MATKLSAGEQEQVCLFKNWCIINTELEKWNEAFRTWHIIETTDLHRIFKVSFSDLPIIPDKLADFRIAHSQKSCVFLCWLVCVCYVHGRLCTLHWDWWCLVFIHLCVERIVHVLSVYYVMVVYYLAVCVGCVHSIGYTIASWQKVVARPVNKIKFKKNTFKNNTGNVGVYCLVCRQRFSEHQHGMGKLRVRYSEIFSIGLEY
jgi:hypothetical protein